MPLEVPRRESCADCQGSGAEPSSKKIACHDCGGKGEIRMSQGFFTLRRTCPKCQGAGEKIEKPCTGCSGSGRVRKVRKLQIKVPAGIETESRLKLSGEGESGHKGGPRGDLYVHITVKPHPVFERRENHLYCEVLVPFTVAALGGDIEVATLEGNASLKIPAASPSGHVFKMKAHGLPAIGSAHRGDLFVRMEIEVPTKLEAAERKLLAEFAKLRGEKAQVRKRGFLDAFKN